MPSPEQVAVAGQTPRTCISALLDGAQHHADRLITFVEGRTELTMTVSALHVRARAVAAGLQRCGVRPGHAVAVQLTNGPECMVVYQAVLLCGATLVPIIDIYGPREVNQILVDSDSVALVTSQRRVATAAGAVTPASCQHRFVVGMTHVAGWPALDELIAPPQGYAAPIADLDDVCLIVYTSGTSATPKGVMHTHRTVLAEQDQLPALIAGRTDDIQLITFPPGHIAGVAGILRSMISGSRTIYTAGWDAACAADLIARFGVTSTAGAPLHLQTLLDVADPDQLVTLREFLVGAAPVSSGLGRRAAKAGIRTFRCYGLSEHPTVTAGRRGDPERARCGTDGAVLPGCAVRIIGSDGRDVAPGVDGEICLTGLEQFVGYTDPRHTAGAFTGDGWLRTGDIGHLDPEGYLTVVGRLKEVILRAGETISARQVEKVLYEHTAVAECAVIAIPDPKYGEIVGAVVVVHPGGRLNLVDVQKHFRDAGVAVQKTPQRLVVVDALPRTALGKAQKSDLIGLFAQ